MSSIDVLLAVTKKKVVLVAMVNPHFQADSSANIVMMVLSLVDLFLQILLLKIQLLAKSIG